MHSPAAQTLPRHLKPVADGTAALIAAAGVGMRAPIYLRVFKEDSELEVWKQRPDGTFAHILTYPICNFSGALGPKERYADYQAPEGFYAIEPRQMRPNSSYHLAFDVGYPNALDRSLGRTGNLIMVHGVCKSVGCFAMTNALIEDLYALARDAFAGGQAAIPIHSFPFRMTPERVASHQTHPHARTWAPLTAAYTSFETTRRLPRIAICEKRYVTNPVWFDAVPKSLDPAAACPPHFEAATLPPLDPYAAAPPRALADGAKTRTAENIAGWATTRARLAALAAEHRRVRRERLQQALVARAATEDTSGRSNLGGN